MLEDAIPLDVSKGQQKTAREVFSLDPLALRDRAELTKEEKPQMHSKAHVPKLLLTQAIQF